MAISATTHDSRFSDQINKLVEDSTISGYHTLNLTTASKDLDVKFSEALQYLTLDLKGKLVQPVTLRGMPLMSYT